MMRWWWFGPSVTKPELEREMRAMKEGGIGGFEVQPVYPLALDDPATGFHNFRICRRSFSTTWRSPASKAHELGLRMDLTLGSGWPFGGPHIPISEAAGRLVVSRVPVPEGATALTLPRLAEGESLIAAFLASGRQHSSTDRYGCQRGATSARGGRQRSRMVLYFIAGHTRAAGEAAGRGRRRFRARSLRPGGHRDASGEGRRAAAATRSRRRRRTRFSATAWKCTLRLDAQFSGGIPQAARLRSDALPAGAGGRRWARRVLAIRHDWGKTLTELCDDNYLKPITRWAHEHGTLFRSQTYGMPPVTLSSNSLGGSAGRRGHAVAALFDHAVGVVGQPPVWASR